MQSMMAAVGKPPQMDEGQVGIVVGAPPAPLPPPDPFTGTVRRISASQAGKVYAKVCCLLMHVCMCVCVCECVGVCVCVCVCVW